MLNFQGCYRHHHAKVQKLYVNCWRNATGPPFSRGATPRAFFHRKLRPKFSSNIPKLFKIILTLLSLFQDLVFQQFSSVPLHFQQPYVPRPGKTQFDQ
ncbi:hypothetical protein Hanom_Chr10g00877291 [Helianthus anomalus]